MHALKGLALPRASHSGNIALVGSRRLPFHAAVLFAHAAVAITNTSGFVTLLPMLWLQQSLFMLSLLIVLAGVSSKQLSPEYVREHFRLPVDERRGLTKAELSTRFPSLQTTDTILSVLYYSLFDTQSGRTVTLADLIGLPLVR